MFKIIKKYKRGKLVEPLKIYNKAEIVDFLNKEVFSLDAFNQHVKEVSLKTKIDEEIVRSVLENYFINITIVINKYHELKRKINIYGYFSLILYEGCYIKNKEDYE